MNRALLVGINQASAGAYASNPLRGCLNDVQTMFHLLTSTGSFAPENITALVDQAATKDMIMTMIREKLHGVIPGDVVVIHYSGHGTQVPDRNGDESDQLDESLVPVDFSWENPTTWITDDEFGLLFAGIPVGVNVTVILDCCNSGTMSRLFGFGPVTGYCAPRYFPPPVDNLREQKIRGQIAALAQDIFGIKRKQLMWTIVGCGAVLLEATKPWQTAADAFIDGKYQGAHTFALQYVLNASKGKVLNYKKVCKRMRLYLKSARYDQVPRLEGPSWARSTGFLFSLV